MLHDSSVLALAVLAILATVCLHATILRPIHPRVVEGRNLTLTCINSEADNSSFSIWRTTIDQELFVLIVSGTNGECTHIDVPIYIYTYCSVNQFNITIRTVQNSMHGSTWTCVQAGENSNEVALFVEVPVKYVNMSINNEAANGVLNCVENETISFECVTSFSRPQPIITWYTGYSYDNASDDISSKSMLFSDDAYNYTRSSVTFAVSRSYNQKWIFCISTNMPDVTPVFSDYSKLNVQYPPVVGEIKNLSVIEMKTVNFTCPVTLGNPAETQFTWTRNVDGNVVKNETFLIEHVLRKDKGFYSFVARNTMQLSNGTYVQGNSTRMLYLEVLYPPEGFQVTCLTGSARHEGVNDTISVIEGISLTLICSARGNPYPSSYSWRGKISANQANLAFSVNQNHSGDYMCTAENTMKEIPGNTTTGANNKTYKLEVLFPPEILEVQNITVIEGKPVVFKYRVKPGNPQVMQFSWTRNVDKQVWENESLLIPSVHRNDESEYTLSVSNTLKPTCGAEGIGHRSKILSLEVLYPPEGLSVICSTDNRMNEQLANVFSVTEGVNMLLTCSANSKPSPSAYSWSGQMTASQATLSFYATKSHAGNYTCTANNIMKEIPGNTTTGSNSKTYFMSVLFPPDILEAQNITIIEGKSFEIKGQVVKGNPQETHFRWTRIKDYRVWNSETFSIPSVRRDDESEYTLLVNNTLKPTCGTESYGYKNKTMRLSVLYPPEGMRVACLTDSSLNETIVDVFNITEGTNLTLACRANSNPSPSSYFWSGKMAASQANLTFYVLRNHSGDYMCTASNSMKEIPGTTTNGTIRKKYSMSVLYGPEVKKMQDITAIEGEHFKFDCPVIFGYPSETTFKWLRMSDNSVWNSQTLSINNITRYDGNTYTCKVNNTLHPTYGIKQIGLHSQNVNIEILYKADIIDFAIEGHSTNNNVTVSESDPVTFKCNVDSNPGSFMKITLEENVLEEKNDTKELKHLIDNTKCTDWGTYYCHAQNPYNSQHNIPRTYITMYVNCKNNKIFAVVLKSCSFEISIVSKKEKSRQTVEAEQRLKLGAPRQLSTIHPANNVTNVTSGQHVSKTLAFKALAYPTPTVHWERKINSSWIELRPDSSNKTLISSSAHDLQYNLTVLNISESDYGHYRLSITNIFGQHIQFFNLIPNAQPLKTDSNVNVVGPAVGGALGVLLFVGAIVSSIVFFRKRQSEKRPDAPIYQNMKTKDRESMSSLDGCRSDIYEKLQNRGSNSDQQYQQLSSFAREERTGQPKIYENLRLTHANDEHKANVEKSSERSHSTSANTQIQSII